MPAPPTNSIEIEKTLTTFRRGVRRFFHPKTGSAPRYTKSTLTESIDHRTGRRIQKKILRPAGVKWFAMHMQGLNLFPTL
ncbi:hypothetical protein CYMTET_33916 [Cymbomonas tetramitiformis]|uniref:Uncharacterized protein n=2 Tax=Cymbomonas tetramitiformis TaxID=36881 RepID=A0AAE0KQH0_9CHLO|nr:hypothetical protein CYMTET_37826 [Cymbomonas tetramitiformis]KAK3256982.1 hypothetical protein CYMTET_33916 [Cymbomonas tetramitiformis]